MPGLTGGEAATRTRPSGPRRDAKGYAVVLTTFLTRFLGAGASSPSTSAPTPPSKAVSRSSPPQTPALLMSFLLLLLLLHLLLLHLLQSLRLQSRARLCLLHHRHHGADHCLRVPLCLHHQQQWKQARRKWSRQK